MDEIDLNLLVVFDVLMQEKNARRSAVRLAITERAVGCALDRLQALIGDPLFLGDLTDLRPTRRAHTLVASARHTLRSLRSADTAW